MLFKYLLNARGFEIFEEGRNFLVRGEEVFKGGGEEENCGRREKKAFEVTERGREEASDLRGEGPFSGEKKDGKVKENIFIIYYFV